MCVCICACTRACVCMRANTRGVCMCVSACMCMHITSVYAIGICVRVLMCCVYGVRSVSTLQRTSQDQCSRHRNCTSTPRVVPCERLHQPRANRGIYWFIVRLTDTRAQPMEGFDTWKSTRTNLLKRKKEKVSNEMSGNISQ
jgi:hypothetical protein